MCTVPSHRVAILCDSRFYSSYFPNVEDFFKSFQWDCLERVSSGPWASDRKIETIVKCFVISSFSSLFSQIRCIAGGNFLLVANLYGAGISSSCASKDTPAVEADSIPPALVAHLLDQHHVPYTGCRSEALSYSLDLVWRMVWYANIPLPPFSVIQCEGEIREGLSRLRNTSANGQPLLIGKATSVWGGIQCYTRTLFEINREIEEGTRRDMRNGEETEGDHVFEAVKRAITENGPILVFESAEYTTPEARMKMEKEKEEYEMVYALVSNRASCDPSYVESFMDMDASSVLKHSPHWKEWEATFRGYGDALMKDVLYGIGIALMTFSVRREAVTKGAPSCSLASPTLSEGTRADCVLCDVILNPSLTEWIQKTDKNETDAAAFIRSVISGLCYGALVETPPPTFVVRLHENPQKGYRLCAARSLQKGEVVFEDEGRAFAIVTRPHVQAHWSKEQKKTFTEYAWPLDEDSHTYAIWERHPSRWRPINHSCDPTCVFAAPHSLNVIAARDISEGEDLTMDYATFCDSTMKPFLCLCGSPECRGWIQADEKSLSKYGAHAWFRRVPAPTEPLL